MTAETYISLPAFFKRNKTTQFINLHALKLLFNNIHQ